MSPTDEHPSPFTKSCEVTRTYLEMSSPQQLVPGQLPDVQASLDRIDPCSVDTWRALYPEPLQRDPDAAARRYALTFPSDDPVKRIDMVYAGCGPAGAGFLWRAGVEALAARERGVIFDIGHGGGSFGFGTTRKMLAAGFLSLDALSDLSNVGSLAAFALVCITVIYLRRSDPGLVRPFRTPLFPVVPILGAVMCAILLMSLMSTEHTRNFFLIYLVGGVVVYFLYGIRKSKLGRGIIVTGHEPEPFVDLPRKGDLDT